MSIIVTEGYAQGFLASMGYGGGFTPPFPPITERMPSGIQIPAPQHQSPDVEYAYDMLTKGHRDKDYSLVVNGYKELQKRYRQEHFVILDSNQILFKGFHEPGAQFKFSDLLAYYPFDGDAVERLKDKSGNNKDLVLAGSPEPTFIAGQSGNAIFFPITGGGKAFYNGSVLPSNEGGFSSMSLSFWIGIAPLLEGSTPEDRTENVLLFRHQNPTQFFDIYLTYDKRICVSFYDLSGNTHTWFSETPILTTSFFQHIVLTYRKSYMNASMDLGIPILSLYVDKSPKLISLYESDADAPRELLYDGDTTIGMDSGCVIDEFRVYGHDLTPSEVITDFNYKANRIQLDTFARASFPSDMWAEVGTPYVLNNLYAILPDMTSIYSNHLLRSKLFERVSKLYVNLLNCDADGVSTISAILRDGGTHITVTVTITRIVASVPVYSISAITVDDENIDGEPVPTTTILPWTFPDLSQKEYILTLWQKRENKNLSLSIGLEEITHPRADLISYTTLLSKTFAHATRITGDYGFVSEYSVTTYDVGSMLLGLSHYEARSEGNIVLYTPASIEVVS